MFEVDDVGCGKYHSPLGNTTEWNLPAIDYNSGASVYCFGSVMAMDFMEIGTTLLLILPPSFHSNSTSILTTKEMDTTNIMEIIRKAFWIAIPLIPTGSFSESIVRNSTNSLNKFQSTCGRMTSMSTLLLSLVCPT